MSHIRLAALLGSRRWTLLVLAMAGVFISATYVGQAVVTAVVFGEVVIVTERGVLASTLAPIVAVLMALLLIRPIAIMVREAVAVRLMTATKLHLRDRVAAQLALESARDPRGGRTGSDNATVVDGIENLDPYLARYLPSVLTAAIVCVAVSTIMLFIDPPVGVVVVLAAAVLPLAPRLWDRVLARHGADHWAAYQDLHAEFVDSMQGMTTLVLYGAAERRQQELADASERLLTRTLRQLKVSLVESGLNTFALIAVPLLAMVAVWFRRDALSATEVFALVLLSVELVRPLKDVASNWHAGYLGTFSGEQVIRILARCPKPGAAVSSGPPKGRSAEVHLDGVCFSYPGADQDVLSDVGMVVRPGLSAIVGASGSGKSTLAAIIAGLCEPSTGSVRVASATAGGDRLLGVAMVPQDPVLFAGTVRSNIEMGYATDQGKPIPIEELAELAGIGTDDPGLSLESSVGERGGLISGGQRQRIAIARGLAQNRSVLVLDEATSALDVPSEQQIIGRILRAYPDRPVIVVAHRLAAVRNAAAIWVLAEGRVVEHGTHASLMETAGRYLALANAIPDREMS
ncbi:MAG: ABC transporter ATP-binding protein/permease [Nocardioides sp.]